MVAQAVIEKIALPIHAMISSDELLPVLDDRLHSRFARERNNCVQMIRHKQTQAAMPDDSLVIKFHGGEHAIASGCVAQLVFARRYAVVGDKGPYRIKTLRSDCYRNRPKIGFNFSTVAFGHSLRSVTSAESSAECSGQLGSVGMRGITSISTFFAVSAFAFR